MLKTLACPRHQKSPLIKAWHDTCQNASTCSLVYNLHTWGFVQLYKKVFLTNTIIIEAYPPLNIFTKLNSNNYIVQVWTKAFFTSLNLLGRLKIGLSSSNMMWISYPFNWLIETYSPLDIFTKLNSNNCIVQVWTKTLFTSLNPLGCLKIGLSFSNMMLVTYPFNWLNYFKLNVKYLI